MQFLPIRCFVLLSLAGLLAAEEVQVSILHTSDIHASIGDRAMEHHGGDLRRMATLLRQERQQLGDDKVLLIDTGDTIQGSLVGVVSQGAASIDVLDALGYDAWILGNHELDFGVQHLRELTRNVKTPILTGNLTLAADPPFASYRIFERAGARLAVIGMTTPSLGYWLSGPRYEGYTVRPARKVLEHLMPEVMRQQPDAIILAMHQGFLLRDSREMNEVKAIAYRFPQIDLILGGHTNRRYAGTRVASSWYVQPGEHATEYSRIQLRIDTRRHRVLAIESTLVPVPPDTPLDPVASEAARPWLEQTDHFARKVITTPSTTLTAEGKPGIDNDISELLCRALAWRAEAPVALHGLLSDESWPAGEPVDEARLFRTIPYENYLCIAHLTLDELAQVVQEQLDNRGSYTYNGIWGLEVEVADQRVVSVRLPGQEVAPETRIPLALSSYNAASGGNRYHTLYRLIQQPEAKLTHIDINSRDILRAYLRETADWDRPARRWLMPVASAP